MRIPPIAWAALVAVVFLAIAIVLTLLAGPRPQPGCTPSPGATTTPTVCATPTG